MKIKNISEYKVMLVKDREHQYESRTLNSPRSVESILREIGADMEAQESVWVFYVNVRNKLLGFERIVKGSFNQAVMGYGDIFRGALLAGATCIIMAHNHPSGNCNPSDADIQSARKVKEIGKMLNIELLDSVIIGDGFLSLEEEGYFREREIW